MTSLDFDPASDAVPDHGATPVAVQILAMLLYGAFAIVTTVMAFVWFWPAGFALAVVFASFGFAPSEERSSAGRKNKHKRKQDRAATKQSGNSSFDSYRAETLARLEAEQTAFDGFLTRLRAARDKVEFDQFIDDRTVTLNRPGPLRDEDDGAYRA